MTQSKPSRRGLLFGAAAALGVVGAGALTWVGVTDPRDFILHIVKSALPGVTLDEPSSKVFAQDYLDYFDSTFKDAHDQRFMSHMKFKVAAALGDVIGSQAMTQLGPMRAATQDILRPALAMLLINSNFFLESDPRAVPIVYGRFSWKGGACINPFATLGGEPG